MGSGADDESQCGAEEMLRDAEKSQFGDVPAIFAMTNWERCWLGTLSREWPVP